MGGSSGKKGGFGSPAEKVRLGDVNVSKISIDEKNEFEYDERRGGAGKSGP